MRKIVQISVAFSEKLNFTGGTRGTDDPGGLKEVAFILFQVSF